MTSIKVENKVVNKLVSNVRKGTLGFDRVPVHDEAS